MELNELLQGAGQPGITAAIEAALMRDGYLLFSGERLQAVHQAMARWDGFTALPIDQRQRFHQSVRDGDRHGGWSLMREHEVYSSHMSQAELESTEPKQEYGFGVDSGKTLWPDEAVAPGFAQSVKDATALLDATAQALLGVFERVLGREAGFLKYEPGYVALKHYPGTAPAAREAGGAGLHEHSDAVVFTMFSQSVEALQLRRRDGGWFTVPADPGGCLVIAPGDWMELFTNGQIPAVRHRVMEAEQARMSLAFFQNVAPMPVGPLARFVGADEAARYPTVASDIDYVGGESGVPRWQTAVVETGTAGVV
ncbi:MAG: 2OG-Fe(II) oxygenase family protein [Alphaproteobacteria bacterium]